MLAIVPLIMPNPVAWQVTLFPSSLTNTACGLTQAVRDASAAIRNIFFMSLDWGYVLLSGVPFCGFALSISICIATWFSSDN